MSRDCFCLVWDLGSASLQYHYIIGSRVAYNSATTNNELFFAGPNEYDIRHHYSSLSVLSCCTSSSSDDMSDTSLSDDNHAVIDSETEGLIKRKIL